MRYECMHTSALTYNYVSEVFLEYVETAKELQDNTVVEVGRDLWSPSPLLIRDTQSRLPKTMSRQLLKTS